MINNQQPQKQRLRGATTQRKKPKQPKTTKFTKALQNPLIYPNVENAWEAWQTFNPGVIMLDGAIHFLYRAIGEDGISRLGYAMSYDGFTIEGRLSDPAYEHSMVKQPIFNYYAFASGGSFGGSEDPRIVQVEGEDDIHMLYTACDGGLRVAHTSIKVEDFLKGFWSWKKPVLISPLGEVHKNWVIFPEKINGKYAILNSISPKISIAYKDSLDFQEGEYIKSYYEGSIRRKKCWDNWVRGVGAPPIKTKYGWLLFYHAMQDSDPGKYKVGAILLDLKDPTKILYRSQEPILEPEKDYENNGFKAGVIYVSGAVVKSGELLVYYGASDSYISVAHANLEEFLNGLVRQSKFKLNSRTVRKN